MLAAYVHINRNDPIRPTLIKQSYTVHINTGERQQKWHLSGYSELHLCNLTHLILVAYFSTDVPHCLRSVDDIPELAMLSVPAGRYINTLSATGEEHSLTCDPVKSEFTGPEYAPNHHLHSVKSVILPSSWRLYFDITPDQPIDKAKEETAFTSRLISLSSNTPTSKLTLVSLSYLEKHSPPWRHPIDKKMLTMLASGHL